jgi:hypothetical protein
VRDRRGNVLRSVTTREPRWTAQDVAELEAIQYYRDGLCPLCGRPIDVCTASEEDPKAAQFEVSWKVCNATRRLSEFRRATYTDDNYPDRAAHLLGTTIRKR